MWNRKNFITAALNAPEGTTVPMRYEYAARPPHNDFDAVIDRSAFAQSVDKSFLSKFSTLTYSRPEEHVGAQAVVYLNSVIDRGLELRGGGR